MERMTASDRERLRALARLQLEYAHSAENERILSQWHALAEGRREAPTVRLLFSNFTGEVITSRQQCEGQEARELEYALLSRMVGRELFGDDTPIQATHDMLWDTWVSPFGLKPKITRTDGMGYELLCKAMGRYYPEVVLIPAATVGATDARFYECICDTCLRCSPFLVDAQEATTGVHGTNERIPVAILDEGVQFFMRYIRMMTS